MAFGTDVLTVPESAADPAAVANQIQVYSKDDGGVTQLFARDSAGNIYQLTPAEAPVVERYTCTGAEGVDFNVNLSVAQPNDQYSVFPALAFADTSPIVGIQCPDDAAGDRTTLLFRVIVTAELVAGDFIDFLIIPR